MIFGQSMELWYSVLEFMSNRLAEKRTNFFGIPSSSKPIILQRSRLSIRIVLHSSSHLLLLFYFFFFVGVCKAITPSLRFIFCVVFCENWKGITRQIFWYFHFIFCLLVEMHAKFSSSHPFLDSQGDLGNTVYSTFSPLIAKLCCEKCW